MLGAAADMLFSPFRQAGSLFERGHRPWPPPRRPWAMGQTWDDLLFAHWPVDPAAVRPLIPSSIPLDTFDGRAWIGVTPFVVRNFRVALTFPLPFVSTFAEINVRTYVTLGGRPGIWFFSLDADSRLAVAGARRLYRLPYFPARMAVERSGGDVEVRSERAQADAPPAGFAARYRAAGARFLPAPRSLEHWLTERYCLYTVDARGRVLRADIHHRPWRLRRAEASQLDNRMDAQLGMALEGEPLLHVADRQDVVFWLPARANG